MKLTLKKLILATIALVLLDIAYLWIRGNYGLTYWISPATLKFWAKDIALLLAWVIYFFERSRP